MKLVNFLVGISLLLLATTTHAETFNLSAEIASGDKTIPMEISARLYLESEMPFWDYKHEQNQEMVWKTFAEVTLTSKDNRIRCYGRDLCSSSEEGFYNCPESQAGFARYIMGKTYYCSSGKYRIDKGSFEERIYVPKGKLTVN
ncbi:hypothetical protein ACFLRA_00830 [Bdellovibrionota bacterium]